MNHLAMVCLAVPPVDTLPLGIMEFPLWFKRHHAQRSRAFQSSTFLERDAKHAPKGREHLLCEHGLSTESQRNDNLRLHVGVVVWPISLLSNTCSINVVTWIFMTRPLAKLTIRANGMNYALPKKYHRGILPVNKLCFKLCELQDM